MASYESPEINDKGSILISSSSLNFIKSKTEQILYRGYTYICTIAIYTAEAAYLQLDGM